MTIAFVTGSRSEWRLVEPMLRAASDHPETLPELLVTGSHLSSRHGHTIDEIRKSGWQPTACIEALEATDSPADVARATARVIAGITDALHNTTRSSSAGSDPWPDWMVVTGDRYESFAAGIAASMLGIPLAHVAGGETDLSTNYDCNLRNALSKLAHVHFVSHEIARDRVLALAEEDWRIRVTGLPSLDGIDRHCAAREELSAAGLVPTERRFLLVSYFPVTSIPDESRSLLKMLLAALSGIDDLHKLIVLSNADSGGDEYDDCIRAWSTARRDVTCVPALPPAHYLAALKHCACYVGNSSSGVIEGPAFGTPVLIVGARQQGRPKAHNILDLLDPSSSDILGALQSQIAHGRYASVESPYGDGHASSRIRDALLELRGHPQLLLKRLITRPRQAKQWNVEGPPDPTGLDFPIEADMLEAQAPR